MPHGPYVMAHGIGARALAPKSPMSYFPWPCPMSYYPDVVKGQSTTHNAARTLDPAHNAQRTCTSRTPRFRNSEGRSALLWATTPSIVAADWLNWDAVMHEDPRPWCVARF